jgi:RNA polymerase sigma-70 factor (ECF subfamily)
MSSTMIWSGFLTERALTEHKSEVATTGDRQPPLSEAAFQAFYHETARPLWSYIRRVCGDPTLADDLLQEAYLRFIAAPEVRANESSRKAYLYRIATNLITDHWRHCTREKRWVVKSHSDEHFQEEPSPGQKDHSEKTLLAQDLSRIFQQLNPMERSLLWLAYVEGSEHREIAATLGLKEKSIRVLLYRARHKLARLLKRRGLSAHVVV